MSAETVHLVDVERHARDLKDISLAVDELNLTDSLSLRVTVDTLLMLHSGARSHYVDYAKSSDFLLRAITEALPGILANAQEYAKAALASGLEKFRDDYGLNLPSEEADKPPLEPYGSFTIVGAQHVSAIELTDDAQLKKLQERILGILNQLVQMAPEAMHELCETRVDMVSAIDNLKDSPVVVLTDDGWYRLGIIGILNGILGPRHKISGVYDGPETKLVKFISEDEVDGAFL